MHLKPDSRWVVCVAGIVREDPKHRDSEIESFVVWVFLGSLFLFFFFYQILKNYK